MTEFVQGPATVVRLVTRLNVGGPARQALLLSRRLAAEFPTILAVGRPEGAEGEMTDPAVPLTRVPLTRPVRPAADLRATIAVRRLLQATRPRLLHTHMAKAGLIGRLVAGTYGERPRLVHTFHGHVLSGYFPSAVERTFLEAERRLARHTDVLIAVSTEVRDSLLDLGVGRPSQFHVVPVGLDLGPFLAVRQPGGALRSKLRLGPDVPLVGIVGRLVPIKDHATLFDALALLPSAHLAVIGDGERRAALQRRAVEMGLEGRVHFLGWSGDVPGDLSDLDVVALSSRNEGTPVALVEALAAARPVVATDVGGVRSVVNDGVSGYLVPARDSDALAARIGRLLHDRDLGRRMGTAGRTHVRDRFGEDRLVDDVATLYRDLIGARARGGARADRRFGRLPSARARARTTSTSGGPA